MRILYHTWLCPFSRKVRLVLQEKKLDFSLEEKRAWDHDPDLLTLNPAGQVPLLVDLNGTTISDSNAICEYLEEAYPERSLYKGGITQRAEIRRLISWFDGKFYQDVTLNLVYEKVLKRQFNGGWPDSAAIRAGNVNIHPHLDYIAWLTDRRRWLAGDELSVADIAAAAHLSAIDYLGDVPWRRHEGAKEWYMRIKSRPSFRVLLTDRLSVMPPAPHYTNLDF